MSPPVLALTIVKGGEHWLKMHVKSKWGVQSFKNMKLVAVQLLATHLRMEMTKKQKLAATHK